MSEQRLIIQLKKEIESAYKEKAYRYRQNRIYFSTNPQKLITGRLFTK
ncbi:hypothetical protein THUN1657_06490 [Rodentibacter abscessus]